MGRLFGEYIFVLIAAAMGLVACKGDMYDNSPKGPLELSQEKITVGRAGTTVHVGVTARDGSWTMTGGEAWCDATPTKGEQGISRIAVVFIANDAEEAAVRTATFTLTSGSETRTIAVEQLDTDLGQGSRNADYEVNEAIHKELLDVWYYNGETRAVAADYNQSYLKFYENYLSSLTRNELDGNRWSSDGKRYLYSYIERNPTGTAASGEAPLNYGMEFDLANYDGRAPVARILYVMKGSPAEAAGLRRGDWFYKVNDTQMQNYLTNSGWLQYNRTIDTLVNPVDGFSPKLGMLTMQPSFGGRLVDEARSVTISPSHFKASPILYSNSGGDPITLNNTAGETTRTGYMVYNSFDPAYESDLVADFARFKEKNLTHFVLDLRYNKSGTVEMAELMANLLVSPVAAGKVFAKYVFAATAASANGKTVNFTPHESGVGVENIFILTSGHTAGAAELLINSLRGIDNIVKVVVIGDVTEGMNVGMVRRTYSADDWEYDARIAAFRCYNARSEGNYQYGLVPNGGEINEWGSAIVQKWSYTWGWKGQAGLTEDPLLDRAMEYVTGKASMPAGRVLDNTWRERSGYIRKFSAPTNMTMEVISY